MRKEIDLGGSTLPIVCNSATPWIAKRLFNFDFMQFITESGDKEVGEKLERLEQLVYTMAVQAKMSTTDALNEKSDGFFEWVSNYDMYTMASIIVPQALELWTQNNAASSTPKNPVAPQ